MPVLALVSLIGLNSNIYKNRKTMLELARYSTPDMYSPPSYSNIDASASSGFVYRSEFKYLENSNNDGRTGSL